MLLSCLSLTFLFSISFYLSLKIKWISKQNNNQKTYKIKITPPKKITASDTHIKMKFLLCLPISLRHWDYSGSWLT